MFCFLSQQDGFKNMESDTHDVFLTVPRTFETIGHKVLELLPIRVGRRWRNNDIRQGSSEFPEMRDGICERVFLSRF